MIKDLPYYRILKNQKVSVREMFHLKNYDDIEKIIIKIHTDYPEGKVKCRVGEEEAVCIDSEHAFLHGYNHVTSSGDLNVRGDKKLECTIEALEDSVVSICIKLR